LLSQFSVQGADKVFEVYAESTAHISQFQDVQTPLAGFVFGNEGLISM